MDESHFETITPEMVGLGPGDARPFEFVPGAHATPIVMSFPHVGLTWPTALGPQPAVDFPRNADFEVHTLFRGVEAWGVATLRATCSRLVVDLNRAADDVSDAIVPDHPAPRPRRRPGAPSSSDPEEHGHRWDRPGRGVVWASAIGAYGRTAPLLGAPLTYEAFARRIDIYHRPYHQALSVLLERRRQRFGYAVLIDAHSMPGSVNVDLVVGTLDGQSCDARLRQFALRQLSGQREEMSALLSVRADDPYRGGEIIRQFGRPELGVHAFQLEVNRRLYMDEHRHALYPWPDAAASEPSRIPNRGVRGLRPRMHHPARPEERQRREHEELLRRVRALVRTLVEDAPQLGLRPEDPHFSRQAAE